MIKTDPICMNRLIINQVAKQSERWQKIIADNLHIIDYPEAAQIEQQHATKVLNTAETQIIAQNETEVAEIHI